jgi:hypothetical protein
MRLIIPDQNSLQLVNLFYPFSFPLSRERFSCLPSVFKKYKKIGSFQVDAWARGQRRASRNHEAVVFPWVEAGPQAFRLSLRKPGGFTEESYDPGRCFRKSRRHPRAQSKLSLKGKSQK